MGSSVLPLIVMAMIPIIAGGPIDQRAIGKRNTVGDRLGNFDYPDYETSLEAQPVVVSKRAALLLDRLLVALQNVVNKQSKDLGLEDVAIPDDDISAASSKSVPSADEQTMDLQRRGQVKGRVYWRCYFNAVTCFKRK
ncbi:hypothetical protein KM043_018301 [Ampulex compressa]|nr:hypothetical protein KM043_018301 [Ampulex compressa]